MASNFPTSLDAFTNPSSTDAMDSVSVPHATQHSDLNDAVEALEAKVGADSSAVTSSHDYKIADHASRLTTLESASGAGMVLVSRTTIGSGVSTVTVSNAFSADYDNYIIVLSGGAHSITAALYAKLGGFTTGYYYGGITYNYSGTSASNSGANVGFFKIGNADADGNFGYAIIQNPYSTKLTAFTTSWAGSTTGGSSKYTSGFLNNTSSITSIEIYPNTGTFNGGYVDVYGLATA